jgi:hypothetical protein
MSKLVFKSISFTLLLGALCSAEAQANTVTAASCNSSAVQSAINSASGGDTVSIPSGTCTWTSGVTTSGKGINITGAGSGRIIAYDDGIENLRIGAGTLTVNIAGFSPGFSGSSFKSGQILRVFANNSQTNWMQGTVSSYSGSTLTMNITSTSGSGTMHRWLVSTIPSTILINNVSSGSMFGIAESTSSHINISGIQVAKGTSSSINTIGIGFTSGGLAVLIHDNWFQQNGGETLDFSTNRGVVWNNSFNGSTGNSGQLATTAAVRIKAAPVTSWTTPSTWGSADTTGTGAVYVESNDFHVLQSATDNDDNGRMVFRYNVMDHSTFATHGADSSPYGQRYFEYYNNTGVFYGYSDGTTFNVANEWLGLIRGGTFIAHDNVLPALSQGSDYPKGNDINATVMNLNRGAGPDGCWGAGASTPGQYYHAPRQVGLGYVTGKGTVNYPSKGLNNSSTDSMTYVGDSEPIYLWNNKRTSGGANVNLVMGFTNYSPSECSNPDVTANYIVLNRDYFYSAKPGYTPYTYPHPLAQGSGSMASGSNPDAPSNLSAIVQ